MKIRRKDNHQIVQSHVNRCELRLERVTLKGWRVAESDHSKFFNENDWEEVKKEPVWKEINVTVKEGALRIRKHDCWYDVQLRDGWRFRLDEGWVKVSELSDYMGATYFADNNSWGEVLKAFDWLKKLQRPMLLVEERGDD